ncbi:NADH-quinone oxidoreductase subunit M [Demequina sp. TTPB684]|uniref:NADH-quinone oxidoreductase subunit M n=1 Tax=unclassified Demequina TaxID=2620311 RepID=UPI001CF2C766|nr:MULTISPECIES: NADH-quinone oxidoreductase subunit M [unclassified Demequina]MCB2411802.1 NADH-quinone oxidoreductase subunit M [Demequina sp. TTPB684]UPU88316.1 NADH-quinone oxidoreductase subunit M [Demequina sp. TMPB413]
MAILTILIAVPAVAGIALLTVPQLRGYAREFALGVAVLEFFLAVGMLMAFDRGAAGEIQFSETYAWIPQIGASWALGVNGIGLSLILLSVVLTPLTMLAGWNEDVAESRRAQYYGLILISLAFMVGIFAARDVFLFYVMFEAMLIPLYFLIGSFGGEQRRYAAVKFLIYSLLGGLIMLVAVIALFIAGPGGEQGFLTANLTGLTFDEPWIENLLFLGFFIAFAIKAPMVPVHTWLPTVAESARAGTTALLVAVLDKVGTFGMLTLCLMLFPGASQWAAPVIIVFAVISVIYGALAAIGQDNMFRLVAFTSVSHFGIMVLGIFAFTRTSVEGATFYMLSHGLSTGALFLLVGFLVKRHGTASVGAFGGLQRVVPVFAGTFLIVGLSALALPGMAPFASEIMVLIGAYEATRWGVIIAALGVILAALYILLMYKKVFTGPTPEAMEPTTELSLTERVVIWPLIAAMLVLGFVPALAVDYFKDPSAAIVVSIEEAGQ